MLGQFASPFLLRDAVLAITSPSPQPQPSLTVSPKQAVSWASSSPGSHGSAAMDDPQWFHDAAALSIASGCSAGSTEDSDECSSPRRLQRRSGADF